MKKRCHTKKLHILLPFQRILLAGLLFTATLLIYGASLLLCSAASPLCVTEICTRNWCGSRMPDDSYSDYLEIYNTSDTTILLEHAALEIRTTGKTRREPLDVLSISPKEYLILPTALPDEGGEAAILQDGDELCSLSFPRLPCDASYSLLSAPAEQSLFAPKKYGVTTLSPGTAGGELLAGKQAYVQEPVLSLASGFYDMPATLQITAPAGCHVIYTTDGSIPTAENGILYEETIAIEPLLTEPVRYASLRDTSTGFLTEEILARGQTPPAYALPEGLPRCAVIRAAAVDQHGNVSAPVTGSYFPTEPEGDCYTVSLTVDPVDFFGHERGIYTLGNTFYDGPEAAMYDTPWEWWYGAYYRTGREQERAASFAVFDADRRLLHSSEIGVRIAGGSSRGYAQKSLRLLSRKELSDSATFQYDFFGDGADLHSLCLFSGGNDTITHMSDYIGQTLLKGQPISTLDFIPCHLYINGEYWGFYYLTQVYDASYLASYHDYDADTDTAVIIRNKELSLGTEEDFDQYEEMKEFWKHADFTNPVDYQTLQQQVDLDSYISYYCSLLYLQRRVDWPGSNCALWKSSSRDCFRYMLFDLNTTGGQMDDPSADAFANCIAKDYLFPRLLENEDFRSRFLAKAKELTEEVFAPERTDALIDSFCSNYKDDILQGQNRYFAGSDNERAFEKEVSRMRRFFHERPATFAEDLEEYLAR